MVDLRPFRALHPPAALAERVAAPPYDVVDLEQARAITRDNPDSFLRVSRPEVDLPDGAPEADVHSAGRVALEGLVDRGVLVAEPQPSLWVYRLERQGIRQTGVVGCVSIDDYDSGVVRTHEHTRPDKEADRVAHLDALDAHDEPVLLLHRPSADLLALTGAVAGGTPALDVVDPDGVRHTLWRVGDEQVAAQIVAGFAAQEALYVADGHHRSAAASRVRALRAERPGDPDVPAGGEVDAFLAASFPADELTVLPYHRLLRDLDGLSAEDVLRRLHPEFAVTESPTPVEPTERHVFGMYLAGRWFEVRAREDTADLDHPVHGLPAAVLQEYLLAPVFGVADPRRDERLAFVGGVHGTPELERLVDTGEAAVAFTLRATTVEDLLAVSDLGEVMPPKSTWFEPKLRSGLLVHPLH